MNYSVRIDDNFLRADHTDGEVLQHTDLNELENVVKTAVNANYEDIQKLQDGSLVSGSSTKLSGASLSTFETETLQNSDNKVPTSMQVKSYVDTMINTANVGLVYYWDGTTGQESADIFNAICNKYDNGEKFVFYGRLMYNCDYEDEQGQIVTDQRQVVVPITTQNFTSREAAGSTMLSFTAPPLFIGYKYAVSAIRLTGTWGNFTDVAQISWSDEMAPAMKSEVSTIAGTPTHLDYIGTAYNGTANLDSTNGLAILNATFTSEVNSLFTYKATFAGNAVHNFIGIITRAEFTAEGGGTDFNCRYVDVDLIGVGYQQMTGNIKLRCTLTGQSIWAVDTTYSTITLQTV